MFSGLISRCRIPAAWAAARALEACLTPVDGIGEFCRAGGHQLAECGPLHPLHREEQSRRRVSRFVNRDDVWIVQSRGRARLRLEAIDCLRTQDEMAAQDLQGDRKSRSIPRQVNLTHSSDCDQRRDFVFPDALASSKTARLTIQQVRRQTDRALDENCLVVRLEQGFNLSPHGLTGGGKQSLTLLRRKVDRFVKQAFDLFPLCLRGHPCSPFISRISHVRARRKSRFTVMMETPKASAVSSMLRPPK